jgi:sugar-specific transcriptional regulator TrmB
LTKHNNNAIIVVMQLIDLAKKLEAVGLTEKQAKVYVAALFLGPSAVQRIGEQAEVNRATTYVILAELAEIGLVSETIEGKKTLFVAEPPEAIERYLNSFEQEITARKAELKKSLKGLKDISRSEVTEAPVVRFFKGPEATAAVSDYLKRKANKNDEVYSISDVDEVLKIYPNILKSSPSTRLKKSISSKIFYSGSVDLPSNKGLLRITKRMPNKAKADLNMYKDKMTVLSYKGDNSTGIIIESEEIVSVIRQLFELAWKNHNNSK